MSEPRISGYGQFRIYLGKCFRLFVSEKQWKSFISAFIIILLVSLVTGDNMFIKFNATQSGAFAILSGCIWIGLFNSIQSVCRERDIVKREHRTGMRISSYILAHAVYELCLCAVEVLIVLAVTLIRNYRHLPPSGVVLPMPLDLYLTLLLVTFASDMIALLISCIVHKENTAMTVMPFVLIVQLVMSGTLFELKGITSAISWLTISKWGLNGVCAVANTRPALRNEYTFAHMTGAEPNPGTLLGVWLVLLVFALVCILLSMLFLRLVDRDER